MRTTASPSDPTWPDPAGGPSIPGYEVRGRLGEGGMGTVYLAEDARLGRKVAIKTMKPELALAPQNRDRFLREAATAAAVESDHIVPILHIGEARDGTPFIVMPLLRGEPLDARLKRDPAAPTDLILKVAREVAAGLAAAHGAGLIHRDVKPANIWLEGDPANPDPAEQVRRCKILDFGLARPVDPGDAQLTASGAILGTPAYMAPEQARAGKVDARADLFSLGCVLYQMAARELPFKGDTAMSVLVAVIHDDPRPVREVAPHLPPGLLDLIDRLMRKDRAERPGAAAEVVALANQLGTGGPYFAGGARPAAPGASDQAITRSLLSPPAPRTWLDTATEAAGAVALVPLLTAACCGAWFAVDSSKPWPLVARGLLLATALAWAVLFVGRLRSGGWRRAVRFAVQFLCGAALGPLALWCDGWGAPDEDNLAAVGVGYALYFGLAACACRWTADAIDSRVAKGRASRSANGAWWRALVAPLLAVASLIAWPRDFAPLELALVVLVASLVAQVSRPLLWSADRA